MKSFTPLFIKHPAGKVRMEPLWSEPFYSLCAKIKAQVGNAVSINLYYYRCSGIPYLALDVAGSLGAFNMTISITGETLFPVLDDNKILCEIELELTDAVDAHYFTTSLTEEIGVAALSNKVMLC